MLKRPEIGSKPHILLWLGSKPEDEVFEWEQHDRCACTQYARDHGVPSWMDHPVLGGKLNELASALASTRGIAFWPPYRPVTFGQLYEAAYKAWGQD